MKKSVKKLLIISLFFLFAAVFSHSQTRADITIFIPTPIGGDYEQQRYFQENFTAETEGAGYTVVDQAAGSDYTLNLTIMPHLVLYDDGTYDLAPWWEPQFALDILLVETESKEDVVRFEFPFSSLPEMYDYNLYLIYQAMANVPLTKLTSGPMAEEDNRWRNKWLYLLGAVNFNVPVFVPDITGYIDIKNNEAIITPMVPFAPGATIGLELQYLNWMSFEANLAIVLGNIDGIEFNRDIVGTFNLSLKFPIKPSTHYMIEPFAGIALPMAFVGTKVPSWGIQGGIQIGVKAGPMGAFVYGMHFEYDMDYGITRAPDDPPSTVNWTRWMISVTAGYKVGFGDRPVRR